MSKKTTIKQGKFSIESVTETGNSVGVLFKNVRLVVDNVSKVRESEYEGVPSYSFCAGLEIPETPEVKNLIKKIDAFFSKMETDSFSGKMAIKHFREKKFQPARDPGHVILYPTSPAKEDGKGGYCASGRFFVKPSHSAFYAGCYVNAKVSFSANSKGKMTVKDYLNAIEFAGDGEPIVGVADPFGNSSVGESVTKVDRMPTAEKKAAAKKRK